MIDPTWNFRIYRAKCAKPTKAPANCGWNERRKRKEELEVRPESGRGFKPERMQIAYTFNAHCIYVCIVAVGINNKKKAKQKEERGRIMGKKRKRGAQFYSTRKDIHTHTKWERCNNEKGKETAREPVGYSEN